MGTLDYYVTGYGGQYETRLGYDPGERALFFGGYSDPELYRFDLTTLATTQMASIPESRLGNIFCSDRCGHIYAQGGSSGSTMWQYDIATDTWSAIPDLPVDHGNNGSCTVSEDGYLYIGTGESDDFYRLQLN